MDGAEVLASRLKVSSLAIGLTVVSLGTSLPEMVVTLFAGLRDAPGLAMENVVGSNIANILFVLGVAAIVRPLTVRRSTLVSELPFSLAAAMLVGFAANAHVMSADSSIPLLSRLDGVLLLFFFALFIIYTVRLDRPSVGGPVTRGRQNGRLAATKLVLGASALCLGGTWAVDGAVELATKLGVDDAVVGLTVVAIGTSAPELFASSFAAFRGQVDIAVGNVVGSNIFNLLWVLGATSSVVELPFNALTNRDLTLVIIATTIVLISALLSKRAQLGRWNGVLLVSIYLGYMTFVVARA